MGYFLSFLDSFSSVKNVLVFVRRLQEFKRFHRFQPFCILDQIMLTNLSHSPIVIECGNKHLCQVWWQYSVFFVTFGERKSAERSFFQPTFLGFSQILVFIGLIRKLWQYKMSSFFKHKVFVYMLLFFYVFCLQFFM